MRIGVVCPYNIFKPGGVQSHIFAQISLLRNRGHKVILITPRPRSFKGMAPRGVYFIGQSARVRAQSSSVDISSSVETEEIDIMYKELGLDIIHFHEPFVPLVARQLVMNAPCPVVSSFHAALPETIVGRSIASLTPYLRPIIEGSDVVIAVSPAAAAHLLELHPGEIKYVPNGINLNEYKEDISIERDKATILFIGRLEKRKGARYLLDGFKALKEKRPDVKLKIAGDGQLKRSLERYCEEQKIEDVEFLGYVDDAKKIKLLRTCSVYCSPAIYGESFGIVLLEAMATGTPLVAHPNPGYEWVLKDTGRLSLVNVKDPYELARRLQLMLEDNRLRNVWLGWARKYVKQFAYSKVVTEYEKIYSETL